MTEESVETVESRDISALPLSVRVLHSPFISFTIFITQQCPFISKLHHTTPNPQILNASAISKSQNPKICLPTQGQHDALSSYKALSPTKQWTCHLCLVKTMVLFRRSQKLIIDIIISSSSLLTLLHVSLIFLIDIITFRPNDLWIAILGQFNFQ